MEYSKPKFKKTHDKGASRKIGESWKIIFMDLFMSIGSTDVSTRVNADTINIDNNQTETYVNVSSMSDNHSTLVTPQQSTSANNIDSIKSGIYSSDKSIACSSMSDFTQDAEINNDDANNDNFDDVQIFSYGVDTPYSASASVSISSNSSSFTNSFNVNNNITNLEPMKSGPIISFSENSENSTYAQANSYALKLSSESAELNSYDSKFSNVKFGISGFYSDVSQATSNNNNVIANWGYMTSSYAQSVNSQTGRIVSFVDRSINPYIISTMNTPVSPPASSNSTITINVQLNSNYISMLSVANSYASELNSENAEFKSLTGTPSNSVSLSTLYQASSNNSYVISNIYYMNASSVQNLNNQTSNTISAVSNELQNFYSSE